MKPKFVIGMGVIGVALAAVMVFAMLANSNLQVSVNELAAQRKAGTIVQDRPLKVTGMVVGDSISYDPRSLRLEFDVVNDREQLTSNLARAERVRVVYKGSKPDTLEHEAQAIVTGRLGPDGKFHAGDSADSLLVQCPTKYEAQK
jgi:cytochrome c-type biogenesis protein CcmE